MNALEKLKQYGKKTISKESLGQVFGTSQDEELFEVVRMLEEEGFLQGVKASKTNGNQRYPIYMKYKIVLPQESYETELLEIESLHPLLQTGEYWKRKPHEYRKYREQIQALDRYLFRTEKPPLAVSRKERSFEIFSEEKQLDDQSFCRALENIGLNRTTLAFYDTPEYCFNDYIPQRKPRMTLLICENKDIWFNVRRRMFEDGARELFGTPIDGVVYGNGNQVTKKEALTAYTGFMGGAELQYLYWGDIDRAGLAIYLNLCRCNPQLRIQLFRPAYEEMLRLARNRKIPDSEDKRKLTLCFDEIYGLFTKEYAEELRKSISENKRIPQEIISYTDLIQTMR